MVYLWILLAAATVVAFAVWFRGRSARLLSRRRAAAEEFVAQRSDLETAFLAAARESGKPRGLRWSGCRLDSQQLFAVDRASGELYALAGATISFEAIEGGGMEEVEAVGNLRYATAVFIHRNGAWTTDGRAVFNLEPTQTMERYAESLEPVSDAK